MRFHVHSAVYAAFFLHSCLAGSPFLFRTSHDQHAGREPSCSGSARAQTHCESGSSAMLFRHFFLAGFPAGFRKLQCSGGGAVMVVAVVSVVVVLRLATHCPSGNSAVRFHAHCNAYGASLLHDALAGRPFLFRTSHDPVSYTHLTLPTKA